MPARFEGLNLPPHFFQLIKDRATIDAYLLRTLRVEPGLPPTPVAPRLIRSRHPQGVQSREPWLPPETLGFRAGFPKLMAPLRGFRAPILDESTNWFPLLDRANHLTSADHLATKLINRRLAYDGLLATLAQVLELLGPQPFASNGPESLLHLRALGFPDDLLAGFARQTEVDSTTASLEVVQWLAGELVRGGTASALAPQLAQLPFRVPARWSLFAVASESGGQELGRLRMQVGGGFANGIVPGDSIHVISQLIAGLPQTDAVISVPDEIGEPIQLWASQALPLQRPGQVTLIRTPGSIESWAQDNSKAGNLRNSKNRRFTPATLTPRYASRQEGLSYFLPSESFLVDGLNSADLGVVHFPLLFQGGNLLAVTDPKTRRRILLLGEGEIHRNLALGLRPDQILDVFRRGFGVDECVVLPAVSYHLDFDVTVREIGGELVAFVNDPMPAVQQILELGIDTLVRHHWLDPNEAASLRYDLKANDGCQALNRLTERMADGRTTNGIHRSSLAAMFRRSGIDSGAGNLQVFLQALTLLESELTKLGSRGPDPDKHEALRALQAVDAARRAQVAKLASLGWRIVPVPSLPNLYRSINYLNGLQHRDGYVMPVFGGFYAPLDVAAEAVFRAQLGPEARILRIQCAELQRKHGAVHCTAVAYPVPPEAAGDALTIDGY